MGAGFCHQVVKKGGLLFDLAVGCAGCAGGAGSIWIYLDLCGQFVQVTHCGAQGRGMTHCGAVGRPVPGGLLRAARHRVAHCGAEVPADSDFQTILTPPVVSSPALRCETVGAGQVGSH